MSRLNFLRGRATFISILPFATLLGCDVGQAARSDALVRDSAGVTIVSNISQSWDAEQAWRLKATPSVDIGVVSGDPEYELYRPLGAVRLSDGRIVVANAGTLELRYYDEGGNHLATAGGRGGGPGEFSTLAWFGRTDGDSIVVFDRRSRRVSVFDPAGRYERSVALPTGSFPQVEGRLSDGSFVARVVPLRPRGAPPVPLGPGQDSLSFLRYGRDGEFRDTLGVFLRRMRHGHAIDFMGRSIRAATTIPFSPQTVISAAGNRVLVGTSHEYQIAELTPSGSVQRFIRKQHSRLVVAASDMNLFLDSLRTQYATGGPEAKAHLALMEATPPPDSMPAFDALHLDVAGNLWVSDVRRPGETLPRWNVFDPRGIWLGPVEGPDGFRATDIGSDYMLGLWKDELEVEHALLYELVKP